MRPLTERARTPGGAHAPRATRSAWSTPGRVDDARAVVEAVAVEHRGGHVERLVVERLGERPWSKSPPTTGTLRRLAPGLHAQRAQRRDDAAAHGVGQREVGDLGREDVADVLLQQLVGGRHADVGRAAEAADASPPVRSPSAVWASSQRTTP